MSETSKQAVERATAFEKTVLPNGLTVLVHPMPGFTGVYALYGTKFGSIDRSFVLDGKRWDLPAGVAHFLEHKMFENEEGDAFTPVSYTHLDVYKRQSLLRRRVHCAKKQRGRTCA